MTQKAIADSILYVIDVLHGVGFLYIVIGSVVACYRTTGNFIMRDKVFTLIKTLIKSLLDI